MLFKLPVSSKRIISIVRSLDSTALVSNTEEFSVAGVCTPKEATTDHLTWVRDLSVESSEAGVLLAPKASGGLQLKARVIIQVEQPRLIFAQLLSEIFREEPQSSPVKLLPTESGLAVWDGRDVRVEGEAWCYANVTIGDNCCLGLGSVVGAQGFSFIKDLDGDWIRFPHVGGVTLGDDVELGVGVKIDSGGLSPTTVGCGTKISNAVQIGHNVQIGERCLIAGGSVIGGGTIIGNDSWIGPNVVISNKLTIGSRAKIEIGSVVVNSVADGQRVSGNFAEPHNRRLREFILRRKR